MKKSAKRRMIAWLTLMVMLIASAMPVSACRNNFVFSKYGVVSSTTRENMVIGYWQAKTKSGISNLEVKANKTFTMTTGKTKKSGKWELNNLLKLSSGKEKVSFYYGNKTLESVRTSETIVYHYVSKVSLPNNIKKNVRINNFSGKWEARDIDTDDQLRFSKLIVFVRNGKANVYMIRGFSGKMSQVAKNVKLKFSKKTGVASFTAKIYGRKVVGKMYVLSDGSRYIYANYQVGTAGIRMTKTR